MFFSIQPMPDYPKIEGCVLDGDAFADCLMTLEFLHNFASALGFGECWELCFIYQNVRLFLESKIKDFIVKFHAISTRASSSCRRGLEISQVGL